jgi:hypothetical protein
MDDTGVVSTPIPEDDFQTMLLLLLGSTQGIPFNADNPRIDDMIDDGLLAVGMHNVGPIIATASGRARLASLESKYLVNEDGSTRSFVLRQEETNGSQDVC